MADEAMDNVVPEENGTTRKRSRKTPVKQKERKAQAAQSVAQSLDELSKKPRKRTTKASKPTSIVFFAGHEEETQPAVVPEVPVVPPMTSLLFQEPDVTRAVQARRSRKTVKEAPVAEDSAQAPEVVPEETEEGADTARKRRRGTRGGRRAAEAETTTVEQPRPEDSEGVAEAEASPAPRKTKKTKSAQVEVDEPETENDEPAVRRRRRRRSTEAVADEVTAPKGSTRLEAKRQRRKEGRESGRRRQTITESEYLARRESVDRDMLIRERDGLNQIAVIEDGILVEHYVARHTQSSMVGNVYLGRVQNVLPSMEAAFVDIGKGRNAVLYAGEVNWDAAGLEGKPRKIEQALKSGDPVLVQVTKDPIGHKGARLTAQITLAGRHLVLVPSGAMTGISRKLPERERNRLKKILKEVVPAEHGVIVRTAAEGASEEQLKQDVERLMKAWAEIERKSKSSKNAPTLLKGEPELAVRVVRDIFNEDFRSLKISGDNAWSTISHYVEELSPELVDRLEKWDSPKDIFQDNRVDEQLQKAFDRKVFLPSGGSLVIDRTEAMTVIDVNTGKFTGSGGSLEETVTRNNLEAAEEIVRQLRLRDIGGIIVVDFIDMVLEANRDLVLRRLIECLGRDRTRHQVAEVTSLGLVQMTRKRVGQGLVEAFSTTCECCEGRGYITHDHPVEKDEEMPSNQRASKKESQKKDSAKVAESDPKHEEVKAALANIAAAATTKHEESDSQVDTSAQEQNSELDHDGEVEAQPRPKRGRPRKNSATRSSESGTTTARGRKKATSKKELEPTLEIAEATPGASDSAPNAQASAPDQPAASSQKQPAGTDGEPAVKKTRRRVSSSGTITPTGPATATFMSFPLKK
ncbi:Rne/Rng family ribonuclease [Arcanobacterium pinnipediorum]|uniref:Rne/Rng family ribonuclease n=1 Tax=Arcanobacterium pinnipediorum TaxID=1503041 RepID=A0ABY5AFJ0_9ACTO|nr:Rne/Rng family ribonuclease [Arcanobacterium pinnipediorum]USR78832.1 Rne/Rng family ribonuclease [Arcanobacterium pinnipediorum]